MTTPLGLPEDHTASVSASVLADPVSAKSVLVVGEALIDIVEEGESVQEFVGGSPANTAIGVARQGHRARLFTRIGQDERGERIANHLANEAVELLADSWSSAPTSVAHVRIEADGSARYAFELDWCLPRVSLAPVNLVHVGSIGLYLQPGNGEVLRLLRERGEHCLVTLDPNIRPSLLLDREAAVHTFESAAAEADLVKLSDEDAEWLYPDLDVAGVLLRVRELGARIAVVTLGAEGSCALSAHGPARVAAVPGPLVDTISAGDSFMASLISCLLERGVEASAVELEAVLLRASCASAIAVSVAGANPPLRSELDALHASL